MRCLDKLNLSKKKIIIFDMDGTLIDSIGVWNMVDHHIIKEFGNKDVDFDIIMTDRENYLVNNSGTDFYLGYCDFLISKYNFSVSRDEVITLRRKISDDILINEIDYKEGAVSLIKKLKDSLYTLVLATVTTNRQIDIYVNKNIKMINQLKLTDYFDLIITKEDIVNKKPNPEIYLKVLENYSVLPEDCLVFEDSLSGVLAAKDAGIEVVNVYDKYADRDRSTIDEIVDYKINNFNEFLEKVNF